MNKATATFSARRDDMPAAMAPMADDLPDSLRALQNQTTALLESTRAVLVSILTFVTGQPSGSEPTKGNEPELPLLNRAFANRTAANELEILAVQLREMLLR